MYREAINYSHCQIWGGCCDCHNYFEARSGVLEVMLRML